MKTLKIVIPALFVSQLAMAQNSIVVPLNEGKGKLEGIVIADGNFRITNLQDRSSREFTLKGDLLEGMSATQFKKACEVGFSLYPDVLAQNEESLKLSGVLFPYTQEALSKLVGHPVTTSQTILGVEPVLSFEADAMTRKVMNVDNLNRGLSKRLGIKLGDVAEGKVQDLNFTRLGTVVCDLLSGKAQLNFEVAVQRERALPSVFAPVTLSDVRKINDELLALGQLNLGALRNGMIAVRKVESELLKKGEFRIAASDRASRLQWNYDSFTNFTNEFLHKVTAQPIVLSQSQMEQVVSKYTVSEYEKVGQSVYFELKIKGSAK